MVTEVGDKVRLKGDAHYGKRGVIVKRNATRVSVRLDTSGEIVQILPSELTNYSFAARKAWERMSDRRVGRPKGSTTTDRVSVTLRIDRELWKRFTQAEAAGAIKDRTATINAWMAEKLAKVVDERIEPNGPK